MSNLIKTYIKWKHIFLMSFVLAIPILEGCSVLADMVTSTVIPEVPKEPLLNVETEVATGTNASIEKKDTTATIAIESAEKITGVEASVDTKIGDDIQAEEVVQTTNNYNSFATIVLIALIGWMMPTPLRIFVRFKEYLKTGIFH